MHAVSTLTALNFLESESETTNQECTDAILSITEVTELAYQLIN